MKLKYNFVINEVAEKKVAVPVGDDLENFSGFVKMNDVGASIFEILKNDVTVEEIVEAMKKNYPDATEQEIRETVEGFTAKLISEGLAE